MRAEIITVDPKKLYNEIFKAIHKGTLETWMERTGKGKVGEIKYLSPLANQYKDVLVEPKIVDDKLCAFITHFTKTTAPTEPVKAIVLGMFSAALLTHLTEHFEKIELHHKPKVSVKIKNFIK